MPTVTKGLLQPTTFPQNRVCPGPPGCAFRVPWTPGHLFQLRGQPKDDLRMASILPKAPIHAPAWSLPPLQLPPGHKPLWPPATKVGRLHLGGFRTLDRGCLSISEFSAKPPLGLRGHQGSRCRRWPPGPWRLRLCLRISQPPSQTPFHPESRLLPGYFLIPG